MPPDVRRASYVITSGVALVVGALAGAGAAWCLARSNGEAASVRPAIAIVDFSRIAAGGSGSPEALDAQLAAMKRDIAKLRHAGFLVLDGQAVLGAPEPLYVPIERGTAHSSE